MSKKHKFETGDILESRWGYDQTNVQFYEVVGTTNCMVQIREIESKVVQYDASRMTGKVMPLAGHFKGEVMRKRVINLKHDEKYHGVSITEYARAYRWEGNLVGFSEYA